MVDNTDPDFRDIIDGLRKSGYYSPTPPVPPLKPPGVGGTPVPMSSENPKADWEPRVSRLEMGFCAACLMILGAIAVSYLALSGKIDTVTGNASVASVAVSDLRGDVKVLSERSDAIGKRTERIEAKIDTLLERK